MKNTKFVFLIILIIALLVVMVISLVKICTTQKKTEQVEDDGTMLVEIESYFSYAIMYDKDTKVIYYRGMSTEADLCPLYNADGSLKLYSGGNNND